MQSKIELCALFVMAVSRIGVCLSALYLLFPVCVEAFLVLPSCGCCQVEIIVFLSLPLQLQANDRSRQQPFLLRVTR